MMRTPHSRKLAILVFAATVFMASTGCAVAARVLAVLSVVHDAADLLHDGATSAAAGATPPTVATGVVTGTHGSGLRLEATPGGRRLAVAPENALVTIECHVIGPTIAGSVETSSSWSRVTLAPRVIGFMSDAFLLRIDDPRTPVPIC